MSNIYEEDKQYILNVYRRMELEIVRGEGSYLYDSKENKYLDMFSGIAVNSLGLNNPGIINRIVEQSSKFIHMSNYFVSEPSVKLAKLLVENSFASKVFFCNSGTEANEAAIKLAKKYGQSINKEKVEILSAYNSFHGRTIGGLSLTGQEKYKSSFKPLMPNVNHFEFNNIEDFKSKVSENTCAVFLEIIQGEGGVREVSEAFMKELNELSETYNFLIVFDEVQTGLFRTGDLFAYEKFNIKPHIVTIAKALGGGIPIGAMLVAEEVENVLQPGDHGSTFGGNSLSCAVGEYILETILSDSFQSELRQKSLYLMEKLNRIKVKYPNIIEEIRGRGMMIGVDVGNYAGSIKTLGIEKQVLLNVTNETVVRLLPPLTISFEEIDEFITKFEEIIESL